LLSLVIKSMSDLVPDDNSDRSKVDVFRNVGSKERSLQDSRGKLHVIVFRVIESVDERYVVVFDPRCAIDFLAQPI